jgi:hypothetical protein
MRRYLVAALFATLALAACEGSRNNTSWSTRKAGAEIVPPLKVKTAPADTTKSDSTSADSSQAKH